jgi:N-acetylglucosaminyl-diphospho-decaprenol L-rhamnosyltransferase
MSSNQVSALVVIVNYRTAKLVVECLGSLEVEVHSHPGAAVTIVDNASGDGSAEAISAAIAQRGWSSWATLLPSPLNGGFSSGNNFAVRPALASDHAPDYFWLLNPDTLVRPGALQAFIDFMNTHPKAGICGGSLESEEGLLWPFAFRFPSLLSEVERGFSFSLTSRLLSRWKVVRPMNDYPQRVDWVAGASFVVRRSVFETIGLMDDSYFLYFEETDFCLRARRAGIECWYVPDSRVMHISGQSTGVTAKTTVPKRLPDYWFDSRRRYFIKNHGRLYAAATDTAWIFAFLLGRLRCWLQRKENPVLPNYFADFFRHSALRTSHIEGRVTSMKNTEK